MEKNYTYSQLRVWRSAQSVAQKIFNLTYCFPEEEAPDLVETIRSNAQSLPVQIAIEFKEETNVEAITPYQKSLELLNKLESYLVVAYDQGCITERELKTILEVTNIYSHCLQAHRANHDNQDKHYLLAHLNNLDKISEELLQ